MPIISFKGKNAVIAGGATGIGKGIALKLADQGCNVCIIDINEAGLISLKKLLNKKYPNINVNIFVCDLTNEMQIQNIVNLYKNKCGNSIQLLFNNVGVETTGMNILMGDSKHLRRVMDLNLWTMIYTTQAFIPLLLNNDVNTRCYICNTGSIASLQSGYQWYSVTKHAVLVFSETIYKEIRAIHRKKYGNKTPCNILVSTLCPGYVITNLFQNSKKYVYGNNKKKSDTIKRAKGKVLEKFYANAVTADKTADVCIQGLKDGKTVISTHPHWVKASLLDRNDAILNGKYDILFNMRHAVKKPSSKL